MNDKTTLKYIYPPKEGELMVEMLSTTVEKEKML